MSILINAHQLKKSFSPRLLFENLTFSIESNDRIGLIGPNGAGKSTLLRMIAGLESADSGTLAIERNLRVGYVQQVPTMDESLTVEDAVMIHVPDIHVGSDVAMARELLTKLELNGSAKIGTLSGGGKKRVAIACELAKRPDLLLLDEPTNHLDVASIQWLENTLANARFAVVTITHDRLFLQRVSNRIIELDRRHAGGLLNVKGDYTTYLEIRAERLSAQERAQTRLENTLRRETEWLRRGAKARSTKQKARIERAHDLQTSVEDLSGRNREMNLRLNFQGAEKNPKKLIEAMGISKSYEGHLIVPAFDVLVTPKSRLGLLGVNGCGKTTLIRMLVGDESPDSGTVRHADALQVAWFEQNRESLDPESTPMKTVCPQGDFVTFRGAKVHVRGYLDRFLFSPQQMDMPVGRLSGGEQARLLIARLMLKEANVLVLDEPTNDLDISTLNVLQDVLGDFPGAVILVSHDRYFLDQVATQILAFTENESSQKVIIAYEGIAQWEDDMERRAEERAQSAKPKETAKESTPRQPEKKKKLTFKEERELSTIESVILDAEARLTALNDESVSSASSTSPLRLMELAKEMDALHSEIDRLYARWADLESGRLEIEKERSKT